LVVAVARFLLRRLDALLPEASRLIIPTVDDGPRRHGGLRAADLNDADDGDRERTGSIVARKHAVAQRTGCDTGEAAALAKDGMEAHLQRCWPSSRSGAGKAFTRAHDELIAVEIERAGTIDAVDKLCRADPPRPMAGCRGILAA
jgi:hypothetical protein